ncbi:MAG TPA: choice-of-anchor Q domain-containing protein, partial [Ktedonobacteraceae bacterium]|nr:choice-of-anchor Q domain-containing protein [Ktedonobacteraceae bacterium]
RLRGTILLTGGDLQFVKNLTLRGPGAAVLAISGGGRGYAVHVTHGVSVSITGLAFKDSNFRGNSLSFITNEGKLILSKSIVSNNWFYSDSPPVSEKGGGGIYNAGTLSLSDTTVSGNTARDGGGGGIYSLGMLRLTNTTVANNTAQSSGGGIYKAGNQSELTFCTIYGNRATWGGGIAIVMGFNNNGKQTVPGFIKITNSIVAANSSARSPDISGSIVTGGYNLIQNPAGAAVIPDHKYSTDLSGMTLTEVRIDSKLQDNGGYTQTLALLMGSPARDGIPLSACSIDGISTDQRGTQRPDDDETACDIGAFESTD